MKSPLPTGGSGWLVRFFKNIHVHLIVPFLQTYDPLPQVAWGTAIGLFVGLTPTVGVQMYSVSMIWLICRYLFRARFNLVIAIAMVWVTNPFTAVPIYYLFLVTGGWLQNLFGIEVLAISFEAFQMGIKTQSHGEELNWIRWLLFASQVFIVEYGWPMVLGSMVYAIPVSLASYPATLFFLHRYRRELAASEGLNYREWRSKYVGKL